MVGRVNTLDARLLRRQCVACGYDGDLLRGGLAARCARCGCDLRRRPARSYVEMEGLLSPPVRKPLPIDSDNMTRMRTRWMAFMVLTMGFVVMIMYLSAAAFSV